MTFLKWVDWRAAKLFTPIGIKLCQYLSLSQYALHSWLWMIVAVSSFAAAISDHEGWLYSTLMGLWAVLQVSTTALAPDLPRNYNGWLNHTFRIIFLFLFTLNIVFTIVVYVDLGTLGLEFRDLHMPMILIAEYIILIKTIPPLATKEKARKTVEQNA